MPWQVKVLHFKRLKTYSIKGKTFAIVQVEAAGIELPLNSSGKTGISEQSGTESGTVGDDSGAIDPILSAVVERWPDLTDDVKASILRLVKEDGETNGRQSCGQ
ncbi:hypothetical protein C5Y97_15650 [Blastopirellula marina]|uniref:Uncharacterized protein n=2 Tax=Blastopirellula marina TaxID=124 RepID=A0A2S8FN95_9BACT|nr:hypothetical protein C5Y98_15640 [Blastopirellula marina]PTL43455.1 hypothetical protein C5Y97_15650 [Blastopirellula marina]